MAEIATQAGHFYDKDGTPRYTYLNKNKEEKPTTWREAKKHGWLPSVTMIIGLARSYGLELWKQNMLLMSALTCPHIEGESNEDWIKRIKTDADEQAKKAREKGTAIHGAIEVCYQTGHIAPEYFKEVTAAVDLVKEITGVPDISKFNAERSFAHEIGYGGKVDLYGENYIIDFKTKEFDVTKKPQDLIWDDYVMQLAACREGLNLPDARCFNVFMSTSVPGLVTSYEWDVQQIDRGWEMFVSLLNYWKAQKGVK